MKAVYLLFTKLEHYINKYSKQGKLLMKFYWRRSRWRNGLARLQQWPCYLLGPGFKSHLWLVKFSVCNKVSPLNNQYPNAKICAMCPNYLAWANKLCWTKNKMAVKFIAFYCLQYKMTWQTKCVWQKIDQ